MCFNVHRILSFARAGNLEKRYNNVLVGGYLKLEYSDLMEMQTMLLRLRQLTGHIFMVQDAFQDLSEAEDIENLMDITASEMTATDNGSRDMLA